MSQQTWGGADLVSDVLLNDIPNNDAELYARVELLETEVHAARDGEASLLAKEDDQDAEINTRAEALETEINTRAGALETEVTAARDGYASLLAKEEAQDTELDTRAGALEVEVTAARDGFVSLLAKEDDQDSKISVLQSFATTGYPSQTGNAGTVLSTDGTMPYWESLSLMSIPIQKKSFSL